ncbi:SusC/RagA family TonB-linked outer membrane protein [Hymenobacter sp. M29]|uniref:SusC/RagA family TonB-linked outer membrane protein n=1 Tax=Hymenobacter mellowenesis TaxID=3063995 RepID=A0ABT9AB19_9BACT|nr:SusC/RagA family TonB-linked outer membrane protein [Hymenobacter sp. M29]MDO7847034.1 SusC/RagA family TonB-linked outer membrane protein [Hymenobacter sp. M29]
MVMLLMTGLLQQVYAQDRTISGRVTDRGTGQGLPGATVLVKGTTVGASTNADGAFSLSIPSSASTLTISSIGYASVDQTIGADATYNVALASDVKQLGEVVVTGALGVQRQAREIGYATATLDTKEINQARVTNVTNGLAGKVSGLQIQTLSNGVNPSVRVTLRGARSATGENQALVVVDGVLSTSEVLTALNPDDIDNITVLKGANAAALYGSQASNGALIITTKKGSNGVAVTFAHTSQFESISFLPKLQNEFGLGAQEYAYNYPLFPAAGEDSVALTYNAQYNNMENQQYGPRFDGRRVRLGLALENGQQQYTTYDAKPNERRNVFNTGYQMQNNVSFSGGDDKSKIFVSFQNVKNNGIVPKDEYNRNAFRLNASRDFGKLTVGFNSSYARKMVDATSNLSAANSVYYSVINTSSMVPLTQYKDWQNNPFANPNGYYNEYYQNPYYVIDNNRTHLKENYFIGDVNLGYKVFDWMSLQYRFGATLVNQTNQNTRDRFQYTPYVAAFGRSASSTNGFVQESSLDYTRLNSDFFINIDKTFGDFNLKLILGNNTQSGTSTGIAASSTGLATPGLFNLVNRIGQVQGSATRYTYHQTSLFADATVGYKEFVYLHASGRNDWSSLLLKSNRSFFYPSVDLSVIFTEAIPVLKEASFIDYGKLRGGIAKVGQINLGGTGVGSNLGAYQLDPFFNLGGGFPFGPLTSFTQSNQVVAPNLKPEFTRSIEAGIELSFLKRRVSTSATYYKQNTTDQTIRAGISSTSGFSGYLLNAGEIQNNGVELDLNLVPVRTETGFEWRVGANYNYNDSKVLSIAPGVDELALTTGGNSNVFAVVGQPFPILRGSYYVRDDQNRVILDKGFEPGTTNEVYFPRKASDLKILGNTLPKHKYGFNTSFSYKGITLAGQAEYRTGYVVYHSIGEDLDFTGASAVSASYGRQPFLYPNSSILGADGVTYVANTDKLTPGGAEFWANDSYRRSVAENYVTKGDFFKIRELSLSYNLPTSMLSGAKFIKGVGLNVFARNLYTWVPKENQYTDPEFSFGNSSANGVGINTILQTPPTKFYGATLSATF